MAAASIPREQMIALLDQLPEERWPEVAHALRALLAENDARAAPPDRSPAPPDEAQLVEVARRALSPEAAARLADLRARERAGRLSDGDRAELHALEGRAERIDNERTAALLTLARMRGVHAMEVMRDLGLVAEGESG
jgi:hypothetical protein